MQPDELRALRQDIGITQSGFAAALGLSRKSVVEMEAGRAKIEDRTVIAARMLAEQRRLVSDEYRVQPTKDGRYMVTRSTIVRYRQPAGSARLSGTAVLFGVFHRRDHAYRWATACARSEDARATRAVERQRHADLQAYLASQSGDALPVR